MGLASGPVKSPSMNGTNGMSAKGTANGAPMIGAEAGGGQATVPSADSMTPLALGVTGSDGTEMLGPDSSGRS